MVVVYYTDQIYLHGGLERVISNKLRYFASHTDYELHVITFQQNQEPPCYEIPSIVNLHDLDISYNRNLSFFHPSNFKHAFKHYFRLKRKLKEIVPDVIVVCNYEFGFYFIPVIAKKSLKIKEFHSSGFSGYQARLKSKSIFKSLLFNIQEYFESKYDNLVLLTEDELKYHKSKNMVVIPNALATIPKRSASLENKRAIAAGRIAPVKGFEYAIRAWHIVHEQHPDWILDIYGNGDSEYMEQLKTLILELKLTNHVFFKGSTNNLEKELLNSSLYIMSSLTECFPMVLLEAMSCGVPCISFDCPNGPRNIISNNENGILVNYLDFESLAHNINYLIENDKILTQLSYQGKIDVSRYSEFNIMPKWVQIFKNNFFNNS